MGYNFHSFDRDQIDGDVFYKLAAHDRLFVTTTNGALYCFGPEETVPRRYDYRPVPLNSYTSDWVHTARAIIEELNDCRGYALMLGVCSGDLLRELIIRSELHIVVVESDRKRCETCAKN